MRGKDKKGAEDHEGMKWKITETMEFLEPMALQLQGATKAQNEEVWESAKRDFRLKKGDIGDVRDSVVQLQRAFEAEKEMESIETNLQKAKLESPEAKNLAKRLAEARERATEHHEQARADLKSLHKNASEGLLRDLHNWMTVSTGELMRESTPDPSPKVSPTP
jgi:chromosome segregation ATPase